MRIEKEIFGAATDSAYLRAVSIHPHNPVMFCHALF